MQWKSGCGHLGSHELQWGGGSTSIVGRAAGKKGIVTPSMCPAVRTPIYLVPRYCMWKYGSVLGYRCVSRCTLVSRCLASIWRIVMFLACDVTADGCCELAPKEDNVHLGPWITEYNLGGWNIVHTARMQSKGWQKGTIQRWETWEWGAGIWTRPTDAWPRIGLPAQKDMIFAGKSKSER